MRQNYGLGWIMHRCKQDPLTFCYCSCSCIEFAGHSLARLFRRINKRFQVHSVKRLHAKGNDEYADCEHQLCLELDLFSCGESTAKPLSKLKRVMGKLHIVRAGQILS